MANLIPTEPIGSIPRPVPLIEAVARVAEDHIKFLMGEVTHRTKNLLAVVQAIAAQTGRTTATFDEFPDPFRAASARARGIS